MRLSFPTLDALCAVVTGDPAPGNHGEPIAPYLNGREIDSLLRSIDGLDLGVAANATSRPKLVRAVLEATENRPVLRQLISTALTPGRFARDSTYSIQGAIDYLNAFLVQDGFVVVLAGNRVTVGDLDDHHVLRVTASGPTSLAATLDAVRRRLDQAVARTTTGDHEGAVTLARTALETLLEDLNHRLPGTYKDAKGDLPLLFKTVSKRMGMDPEKQDVEAILSVLRGFASIVNGLAAIRNRMGDVHATRFRVHRHHAVLAVNAVTTLVNFVTDSIEFQRLALHGEST